MKRRKKKNARRIRKVVQKRTKNVRKRTRVKSSSRTKKRRVATPRRRTSRTSRKQPKRRIIRRAPSSANRAHGRKRVRTRKTRAPAKSSKRGFRVAYEEKTLTAKDTGRTFDIEKTHLVLKQPKKMTRTNFKDVIKKTLKGFEAEVFRLMKANRGKLALIRVDTSFGKGYVTEGWKDFKEKSDGMGFGLRRFKLTDDKYLRSKIKELTSKMLQAYSVYILNGTADFGFINSISLEIS